MIQAICWTLVHSLWQGLLFAMVVGIVMLITRKVSAAARYNVLCGLFFGFLLVVAGTFIYEWRIVGENINAAGGLYTEGVKGALGRWIEALGEYCSAHAVPIVWGWLFIFMFKTLRLVGSLLYTQRIRNYGISAPPGDWQQRVNVLARQLGIGRAVRLVESRMVKVPLVAGIIRPMIFMPMGLLTGLPEGEIEAVLLHELAHIRRNDYLVNFLQHLAGNILFFNPGFLWMSALLRDERENCCDDIAIDKTRDRIQFVRALISFKEHDLRNTGMANAFPARKQQLLKRVTRIAHHTNKTLDPAEKVFLLVSSLLIFLLVAATADHSKMQAAQILVPKGNNRIIQDRPRLADEGEKTAVFEDEHARKIADEHRAAMTSDEEAVADAPPVKEAVDGHATEHPDEPLKEEAGEPVKKVMNADHDHEQAERDRQQALDNKKQAEMDAQQAERDRQQAERDKQQADRDRMQADKDRMQADRDRQQAERNREQAERDRQQGERDREQAERDRQQALKDAHQRH